jgi:hypothetical protein
MKTASILSDWSVLFNPKIKLILLSKPYQNNIYFPFKDFSNSIEFKPIS